MVLFLTVSTLPSLDLPSSTNYTRHSFYDPLALPLRSCMPTIQYLSTTPRFPPFNLLLLELHIQIRGHIFTSIIVGFSHLSPLRSWYVRALHFYHEKSSALSSLVDRYIRALSYRGYGNSTGRYDMLLGPAPTAVPILKHG